MELILMMTRTMSMISQKIDVIIVINSEIEIK